ncbi:MAG: glycoside hydrolase family 13 protein [Melioribacteraceae bacterium]|nr:glycoside hydrolase family 13 protein [Melioribacteraceae bacterium]
MKKIIALLIAINSLLFAQTNFNEPPAWAKEAIWYQIFPERFFNGDKSNDPKPIDMQGAWPFFVPQDWKITPWTWDWYKLQTYEKKLNKNFYEIVNIRRYGGDIQGVIDKLDYLQDLGITAIYLNPIFESPSLHKYDATMYHHVDNNFGPNPERDRKIWSEENPADPSTWQWTTADKLFLKLIDEVHKRGMKIIIDGVFNHMGLTSWAFQDVVKNQEKSEFKDWFTIKKFDDPSTPQNEFDYAGWYGIKDLPELREDENGIVEGPREHIHAVVKRWMDPNNDGNPSDGIDGWRLDVAEMVNHNFWKIFRKWVRDINPNAYLVGEVWWEDWRNDKMFDASPWLKGDQFDAVMNYRFTRANKNFVLNKNNKDDVFAYIDSIKTIMNNYKENYFVMMNLLGSHDTERLASVVVNPDFKYDHGANARDSKNYDIRKPTDKERLKQKFVVALQFTQPGAPHIFNGDEAGMWGGDDPDDRKPNIWKEFKYDDETTHPFGKPRTKDKVEFDQQLFNFYKTFIKIRNENKVLSLGTIEFYPFRDDTDIIIYERKFNNERLIIVGNNSFSKKVIDFSSIELFKKFNSVKDFVSDKVFDMKKLHNKIKINPYQLMILKTYE